MIPSCLRVVLSFFLFLFSFFACLRAYHTVLHNKHFRSRTTTTPYTATHRHSPIPVRPSPKKHSTSDSSAQKYTKSTIHHHLFSSFLPLSMNRVTCLRLRCAVLMQLRPLRNIRGLDVYHHHQLDNDKFNWHSILLFGKPGILTHQNLPCFAGCPAPGFPRKSLTDLGYLTWRYDAL